MTVKIYTDASVTKEVQSYAYLIVFNNSVVKHSDILHGNQGTFIAESKAIYLALKEMTQHPEIVDQDIKVICDNAGVINAINYKRNIKYIYEIYAYTNFYDIEFIWQKRNTDVYQLIVDRMCKEARK